MREKFQLAILKTAKDIQYNKPERIDPFIYDKYEKIDKACSKVAVATTGQTFVPKTEVSTLLGEDKPKTEYIIENKMPGDAKIDIGGEKFIKTSDVIKILCDRSQEHRNEKKRILNRYSAESLININHSPVVEEQVRAFQRHSKKLDKELKQQRIEQYNVVKDEISGEALENPEMHHVYTKTVHTDPNLHTQVENVRIVNQTTHKDIHRKNINDKNELDRYKAELNKKNR